MYSKEDITKTIDSMNLHTLEFNKDQSILSFSIMTQIRDMTYLRQDFKIFMVKPKKKSKKTPLTHIVRSSFKLHEEQILGNIAKARASVSETE